MSDGIDGGDTSAVDGQTRTRVGPGASSGVATPLTWLSASITAVAAVAVWLATTLPFASTVSIHDRRWFADGVAAAGMIVIALGVLALRAYASSLARDSAVPGISGILIGKDNRLSTSKLAAFVWTVAIAWAILALAVADWVGATSGWTTFVGQGLQDQYLILLGGPFIALVSGKAIVQTRVSTGAQIKPPAMGVQTAADRVSQAFSDDDGQTDLVDTQYLIFTAVALIVFVVMFLRTNDKGFPTLPDFLVGLTSAAAVAYVANKATASNLPPHIDRVVPDHAHPGDTLVVYGRGFLSVAEGGQAAAAGQPITALFGTVASTNIDPNDHRATQTSVSGSDTVTFSLPDVPAAAFGGKATLEAPLTIRNPIGQLSDNQLPFTLETPPV